MDNLDWLTGPPGTGKTRWIATKVAEDIANPDIGPDGVMITSLTRAAAAEIASRKEIKNINHAYVSTLHGQARRVLQRHYGQINLAHSALDEWNDEHPTYKLTKAGATDADDPLAGATDAERRSGDLDGDALFGLYQLYRAKLTPREQWQAGVQQFARRWEDWKRRRDLLDFNDLIDVVFEERLPPPAGIKRIYVDEAQDHDASELRLLQFWGQHVERLTMVGDTRQTLYSWRGADPRAFELIKELLPDDNKTVLRQSFRVPRAVHRTAVGWINRISGLPTEDYAPKDADGQVRFLPNATIRYPEPLIQDVTDRIQVYYASGEHLQENEDLIMILTTCGYQLEATLRALREAGIPYRNRYRASQGRWNPLGSGKGVSAATRLLSYLRPSPAVWGEEARMWTVQDLRVWVDVLEAKGVIKHGMKKRIETMAGMHEVPMEDLVSFFEEDALAAILDLKPAWLLDRSLAPKRKALQFVTTILERRGPRALREHPLVTVGTIHCSPADEPVLTTRGYVPIGELDPAIHRLAGFHYKTNRLTWGRGGNYREQEKVKKGFEFVVAKNPYCGPILTIKTEKSTTRVTPDHRVRVRWASSFLDKWVVYLMRRGDWWRVGICTSARMPYRAGGIGGRLSTEQADAGWILSVHETRREAVVAESVVQGKYGIPGLTFEAAKGRALTRDDLHQIHEATSCDVQRRVRQLFAEFRLNPQAPLYWRKGDKHRLMLGYGFETVAANIIPGYMLMPVAPPDFTGLTAPEWLPLTVERNHFDGDVYSLEVFPDHHYVSGGAIVHNSVKGGEARHCYLYPDLSPSGAEDFASGGERRDALVRLQYVGATRSSDTLTLCGSAGKAALQW